MVHLHVCTASSYHTVLAITQNDRQNLTMLKCVVDTNTSSSMLSSTPIGIAGLNLTMNAATKDSLQPKEYTSELNWITKIDIPWNEFPKKLIQAREKGEKTLFNVGARDD